MWDEWDQKSAKLSPVIGKELEALKGRQFLTSSLSMLLCVNAKVKKT